MCLVGARDGLVHLAALNSAQIHLLVIMKREKIIIAILVIVQLAIKFVANHIPIVSTSAADPAILLFGSKLSSKHQQGPGNLLPLNWCFVISHALPVWNP